MSKILNNLTVECKKKKNKNVLGALCVCATAEMFYSSKQMKKQTEKAQYSGWNLVILEDVRMKIVWYWVRKSFQRYKSFYSRLNRRKFHPCTIYRDPIIYGCGRRSEGTRERKIGQCARVCVCVRIWGVKGAGNVGKTWKCF